MGHNRQARRALGPAHVASPAQAKVHAFVDFMRGQYLDGELVLQG